MNCTCPPGAGRRASIGTWPNPRGAPRTHPATGRADLEATRVLRLITRLNIGGPARQALLLTRALEPDFTTTLVSGTAPTGEGELSDPAVTVHRAPLVRPIAPAVDIRAFLQVRRLMVDGRHHLLHTHMAKAGTVGRLAARSLGRARPRTVHTFHGHVLEGYFRPVVSRAFLEAERRLARTTDVLVAVSTEIRDQLLELGIGRPAQWRVIPLGFDLAVHLAVTGPSGQLRRAIGLAPDEPLAGIVGRLAPIKDHVTAFEAVRQLPGVHLAVLGDGELRAELEALSARLGIADRVHFTGWWMDIPAAMADLDVVVLTSRNEGTPVSLIEAAACGRPVVATDVGGVASVVSDGEHGLLVPAGDPSAAARAIAHVLADRAEAARLGQAGRSAVLRFDQRRLVEDIRALYLELRAP